MATVRECLSKPRRSENMRFGMAILYKTAGLGFYGLFQPRNVKGVAILAAV
jgi:hypothetical protein